MLRVIVTFVGLVGMVRPVVFRFGCTCRIIVCCAACFVGSGLRSCVVSLGVLNLGVNEAMPKVTYIDNVKALSIRRPWADAILLDDKDKRKTIENRSWRPPGDVMYRLFMIHTSQEWDSRGAMELERRFDLKFTKSGDDALTFGALVGWAVLGAVIDETSMVASNRWFDGAPYFGYVLTHVGKFAWTTHGCRGQLRFFTPPKPWPAWLVGTLLSTGFVVGDSSKAE